MANVLTRQLAGVSLRLITCAFTALGLVAAVPAAFADTTVPCSASALIQAINDANANNGDTLDLAPRCTYSFASADNWWYGPNALPPIQSEITIHGHGATLEARHSGDPTPATSAAFRFFYVSGGLTLPAGQLAFDHLTLTGGYAKGGDSLRGGAGAGVGGAIFNQGSLQINAATLRDNVAQGGNGGYSEQFSSKRGGGGIGQNVLEHVGGGFGSAFAAGPWGGQPGDFGMGGAHKTYAGGDGGAGGGGGAGNEGDGVGGTGGFGGGGGDVGGHGGFGGGGGGNFGSGGFGGGNAGYISGGGGGGMGGAVFNDGGIASLVNVTLTGNRARGGSGGPDSSGQLPPEDGSGLGGAVFNLNGSVTLKFCSLAGNAVSGSNGENATRGKGDGAAVYSLARDTDLSLSGGAASITLQQSIVYGNTGASYDLINNLVDDGQGNTANVHYVGSNIVAGSGNTGTQSGPAPLTTDPALGPLADNGGLAWTMMPGFNGAAVDAATSCAGAGGVDQRGVGRPQGSACDLGAVERVQSSVTALQRVAGDGQYALAGHPFAWPLVVRALNAQALPVSGAFVHIQVPAQGASASCGGTGITDQDGYASIYCIANGSVGRYPVRLSTAVSEDSQLSQAFTLANEPGDLLFADGFDTITSHALFTPTQDMGRFALDVPGRMARGSVVPILIVSDGRGHRVASVQVRQGDVGPELRVIRYDAHGWPVTHDSWQAAGAGQALLQVTRHNGVARTTLYAAGGHGKS